MSSWPEPASYLDALPTTIKYCKSCQNETTHQIRVSPGMVANICCTCLARAMAYEMNRD